MSSPVKKTYFTLYIHSVTVWCNKTHMNIIDYIYIYIRNLVCVCVCVYGDWLVCMKFAMSQRPYKKVWMPQPMVNWNGIRMFQLVQCLQQSEGNPKKNIASYISHQRTIFQGCTLCEAFQTKLIAIAILHGNLPLNRATVATLNPPLTLPWAKTPMKFLQLKDASCLR